jgi:hypothetical protein
MTRARVLCSLPLLLLASLAAAQGDPTRYRTETAAGRLGDPSTWPEFEVVSVQAGQWTVVARDVDTGEEFEFRMPPQTFRGQVFSADLSGAGEGQRIDVQGQPEAKLDQATLQTPLGQGGGGGGLGGGSGVGGMRRQEPPRTDFSTRNPYPRSGGERGREGGPMQYRIDSIDPDRWTVSARGGDGSMIELKIEPEAFVGYRFKAPVRSLRAGEGFAILALNQRPIEGCCTVVGSGQGR